MFVTNRVVAKNITDEGLKLYGIIKNSGAEGCTRKGLSAAIGKSLNNWHFAQIALLVELGYVTTERTTVEGRWHLLEYVYRATDTDTE